jgi:hypothetical protein
MTSLTDKLKKQMSPDSSEETPQCSCGSHLEGECPECNDYKPPGWELRKKLQALGDKRNVNPPEDGSPSPSDGKAAPPASPPSSSPPTSQGKGPGGVCPYCSVEFRHLSRHRCKQAPKLEPEGQEDEDDPSVTVTYVSSPPSFTLLIDCIFSSFSGDDQYVHVETLIKDIAEGIAKEHGVEHWSIIQYNPGPGLLAARLEKFIQKEIPTGFILLDSMTQEGRACKEVLRRYASAVIQGVK